jgi:hypothetical protein
MRPSQELFQRISAYPSAEAQAVIFFLLAQYHIQVKEHRRVSRPEAIEHAARVVLDFICAVERKAP